MNNNIGPWSVDKYYDMKNPPTTPPVSSLNTSQLPQPEFPLPTSHSPIQLPQTQPNVEQQQLVNAAAAPILQSTIEAPMPTSYIQNNKLYKEAKELGLIAKNDDILTNALKERNDGTCALRVSSDGKGLTISYKVKRGGQSVIKKLAIQCYETIPDAGFMDNGSEADSLSTLLNKVTNKYILMQSCVYNWKILQFDESKCTGERLVSDIIAPK